MEVIYFFYLCSVQVLKYDALETTEREPLIVNKYLC